MARRRRRGVKRNWSQADVYTLVRRHGGSDHEARFLAGVVPGESGGRLNVINSIGATGLFQIYNGNKGGERNLLNRPGAQARAALRKLRTQGKGAWAASRGAWKPFQGRGSGNIGPGGGGPGGTLTTPGKQSVDISRETTFDKAAFEKARKASIVGQLIAKRKGTGGVLFKTGLLSTEPPDPASFTDTRLRSKIMTSKGSSINLGGGGGGGGGSGYPLGTTGKIIGTPFKGTHTLGNWQSDRAIDIGVPVGTRVLATSDGVVVKVSKHPMDGGRFAGDGVTIRGRNGDEYFFKHIKANVRPGQRVRGGQVIGRSGSANGVAHLHFARRRGSIPGPYARGMHGKRKRRRRR